MKYILTHVDESKNKTFKCEEKLQDFLVDNLWTTQNINHLFANRPILGWSLEIIPSTNKEAFKLLWNEVYEAFIHNDYDDDLTYFVINDYRNLAVNSWQNSGASKYNFSAKISKAKIKEEFKHFWDTVDSFTCPSCNHVGFYEYDESCDHVDSCYSCHKRDFIPSNRGLKKINKLLKDIAS